MPVQAFHFLICEDERGVAEILALRPVTNVRLIQRRLSET